MTLLTKQNEINKKKTLTLYICLREGDTKRKKQPPSYNGSNEMKYSDSCLSISPSSIIYNYVNASEYSIICGAKSAGNVKIRAR